MTASARRRVYLMRHAEVSYFREGGASVDFQTVPLTERGEAQARSVSLLLEDVPLDLVVHSGLTRTEQTAGLVVSDAGVPVEVEPRLAELEARMARVFAEGLEAEALRARFVTAFDAGGQADGRFLGGERFADARARVMAAWGDLLARADWRRALVVAHGGVNRILLAEVLGAGDAGYDRLEQDPACVNMIEVSAEGTGGAISRQEVRLLNHTPYDVCKCSLERTTMEGIWEQFVARSGR